MPFWMPFTANRQFKAAPRIFASAQGHALHHDDGRRDPRRHRRPVVRERRATAATKIVEAIQQQAGELDYAPPFSSWATRCPFKVAERLKQLMPARSRSHVLHQLGLGVGRYRAEDRARLPPRARRRHRRWLIGRERGYHGVNFGGISVGGMPANRKVFGNLLPTVDHLPHTHDLEHNSF